MVAGGGREPWLLCGGIPCQPFSVAGQRRGVHDPRHLWPAVAGLVRGLGADRPDWVLVENVRGFVRMALDDLLADLDDLGYAGRAVINVAMGGTLWQDIGTQVPGALNHRDWEIYERNTHATSIVSGTPLAKLYPGVTLVKTNSIHHQAVKDLGRKLVVEAWSEPDRGVEAIRWTGPSYLFGVQWHPEFHPEGDRSFIDDRPILDDFLRHARTHKTAAYAL